MSLTASDVDMIMAIVSQKMREQYVPLAEHGVAVSGSWSAVDDASNSAIQSSTFQATPGKTAAISGDDGDQGFAHQRIDHGTTAIGDQFAPRGGERTVMVPTEEGPVALFIHGPNDTNATLAAGERIIAHRNTTPAVDVSIHLANDGKAARDGLGSLLMLAGALLKIQTAGGTSIMMDDAANAILLAAQTIQLAGSGTTADDGIVRKSDLRAAITALAAIVQPGSGVTPPTVSASAKSFTS